MSFKIAWLFPQFMDKIFLYPQDFLPIKFFFQVSWTDEMTRVISASRGINTG